MTDPETPTVSLEVTALIEQMQLVKQENPVLEIPDVLRIFEIQALKDLTKEIHMARKHGR